MLSDSIRGWEPGLRKNYAQSKGSAFVMGEGSLCNPQIVP
jgi:hypothetical protein